MKTPFVTKEQLEQNIVKLVEGTPNPTFTFRADENTKHKDVVFAMEIAEKHKYGLAIATVQE